MRQVTKAASEQRVKLRKNASVVIGVVCCDGCVTDLNAIEAIEGSREQVVVADVLSMTSK